MAADWVAMGATASVALAAAVAAPVNLSDGAERPPISMEKWHFYSGYVDEADEERILAFGGNATPALAAEVGKILGMNLANADVGQYADGETAVTVKESVRGRDVYLIQSTCAPVNDNVTELLLMVTTMRRASARRISVVIPYFGYGRQDRKVAGHSVPISAADVAKMLEAAGVDEVVCVDLHNSQIQGFFPPRIPCLNLTAVPVGAAFFAERSLQSPVVVAPSPGSLHNARNFRDALGRHGASAGLAIVLPKPRRQRQGKGPLSARGVSMKPAGEDSVLQASLVGSVRGSDVIIVDDMIDTSSSCVAAAKLLKQRGAARVFVFATHGVLSGSAHDKIRNCSELSQVVVTNTIPPTSQAERDMIDAAAADEEEDPEDGTFHPKIYRLSIAPLLAEAIRRIHNHESVAGIYSVVCG